MLAHESLSYGPAGVRVQHSVPVQQAGPHAPVGVQAAIARGVVGDKLLCYFHRAFCPAIVCFPATVMVAPCQGSSTSLS